MTTYVDGIESQQRSEEFQTEAAAFGVHLGLVAAARLLPVSHDAFGFLDARHPSALEFGGCCRGGPTASASRLLGGGRGRWTPALHHEALLPDAGVSRLVSSHHRGEWLITSNGCFC